jgi:hypothetical protein
MKKKRIMGIDDTNNNDDNDTQAWVRSRVSKMS